MSVSFRFTRGGLIHVRVCLEHATMPVWARMALDTGARLTVITPRLARVLGLDPDKAETTVNVFSATGTASAGLLRVASVSVSDAEVKNVRVVCYPLSPKLGLEGILGLNYLDHFNIEIRNETETVVLTRWRE